jgi:type II secretory pathway pseudopilin PulG
MQARGFTYLGVLLVVAIQGAALAAAATVWHTLNKREKEAELLFIGHQFRQAIGSYYRSTPGGVGQYPKRLEDLLLDPRHTGTVRHLRRLWRDPMTGKTEWGLLRDASGGIVGVFSLSTDPPLKTAHFDAADRNFEGQTSYAGWQFIYEPSSPETPRGLRSVGANLRAGED